MSNNKVSNEENLGKAKSYLQRFSENITGHFINGQFEVPTNAETFENFTPVDNTTLGKVVSGSNQDIDRACDAAKAALQLVHHARTLQCFFLGQQIKRAVSSLNF